MSRAPSITPQEFHRRQRAGDALVLVDVRSPAEFAAIHATSAVNLPLDELAGPRFNELRDQSADDTLGLICHVGGRSRKACDLLMAGGVNNLLNVDGGTQAWEQAGLPVTRGRGAISIERQVRIAAGSLVLLGLALGWAVHSWFVGLSAFVGAGLVFSGVTDFCGMGLLLARMPWNRRS